MGRRMSLATRLRRAVVGELSRRSSHSGLSVRQLQYRRETSGIDCAKSVYVERYIADRDDEGIATMPDLFRVDRDNVIDEAIAIAWLSIEQGKSMRESVYDAITRVLRGEVLRQWQKITSQELQELGLSRRDARALAAIQYDRPEIVADIIAIYGEWPDCIADSCVD